MDWDRLKIFHAVAEAGSFTNATVNLNLSQSAISRQIQSLEQDLQVQLFERHARGLTLTENGEYVFKTAHEVISKLKEVETTLGDQKNKPTGKLTITTVRSFGTHWLTPRIQEFMRLNPDIEIELIFEDKELDLSTRQADIGIFMRRPKQLSKSPSFERSPPCDVTLGDPRGQLVLRPAAIRGGEETGGAPGETSASAGCYIYGRRN